MIRRVLAVPRGELSLHRWRSNPYQMFDTVGLGVWSLWQLVVGVTANTPLETQVDPHAQILISLANLFGAVIAILALHLRDQETGTWLELTGYVSLVGTLMIYVALVATEGGTWLNTGYGYGLAWMFVFGSTFRTVQILLLKRAEFKAHSLAKIVAEVLDPNGEYADG